MFTLTADNDYVDCKPVIQNLNHSFLVMLINVSVQTQLIMFLLLFFLFYRSFVELLLSLKNDVPDGLWKKFKASVQVKMQISHFKIGVDLKE